MVKRRRREPAFDAWAAYYDTTDADRSPFVAFYRGLLTSRTQSLLELGCGTGVILTALAEDLYARRKESPRVVGVDESPQMLRVARDRSPRIEWVVGDMRSPPIKGSFDLVISCFNTVQFLRRDEDLASLLRSVRKLLGDGGAFAFDIYQPNAEYLASPHRDRMARAVTDSRGRRLEIREDTRYEGATQILTIDWRLVDAANPRVAPLARARFEMRQYFAAQLDRILAQEGFVVRERYGDLGRSAFTKQSKKQVLVIEPE